MWQIQVSQGSVATRLRCGGIFIDQYVYAQSLLSQKVKEFWKSFNICRSYRQESSVLPFWIHGAYSVSELGSI